MLAHPYHPGHVLLQHARRWLLTACCTPLRRFGTWSRPQHVRASIARARTRAWERRYPADAQWVAELVEANTERKTRTGIWSRRTAAPQKVARARARAQTHLVRIAGHKQPIRLVVPR
jgi:hypothetical protein